jgi:YD repeat-containing protein
LNRLTQVGAAKAGTPLSRYAYTLGAAGNRLTVAELSGRNVAYGYDSLYRLTTETVSADPGSHNFTNGFTYDAVGNRDNGNVYQIVNSVDSTRSTAFAYDSLNRISQANTVTTTGANCWGETYTIDAWGNLTNRSGVSGMTGCSTELLNAGPASTNQLSILTHHTFHKIR